MARTLWWPWEGVLFLMSEVHFGVSGFGFRVWVSDLNSGLQVWVQDSGFQVSVLGFQVSGFGFQVSGFRFRISGLEFRGSGFGFRVSVFVVGVGVKASGVRLPLNRREAFNISERLVSVRPATHVYASVHHRRRRSPPFHQVDFSSHQNLQFLS